MTRLRDIANMVEFAIDNGRCHPHAELLLAIDRTFARVKLSDGVPKQTGIESERDVVSIKQINCERVRSEFLAPRGRGKKCRE